MAAGLPERRTGGYNKVATSLDDIGTRMTLFSSHPRQFSTNRYVYPVLSRRAGGVSVGVNLSPDQACNFRCVYCQVDRSLPPGDPVVDLERLAAELDETLEWVRSGRIFEGPRFCDAPPALRRLNDIALSGDGEPTACAHFEQAVDLCIAARRRLGVADLKIVLITNATLFHRASVQRAMAALDANGGEIWAKLDAGTEAYYRQVNRSSTPWRRILENLRDAALVRPLVLQTLLVRMHGQGPTSEELDAYCDRLNEMVAAGGRIRLVQIHTIARRPAESWATALCNTEVDAAVERVRARTGLAVAGFYGQMESEA
ncbi:MAG: radical SAM protein [Thermoguttaceae bacterium]